MTSVCDHQNLNLVVHEEGVCDFDRGTKQFKGEADSTGFFYITRAICKDCKVEFTESEIMFLTGLPKSRMMSMGLVAKPSMRCSGICDLCTEFLC